MTLNGKFPKGDFDDEANERLNPEIMLRLNKITSDLEDINKDNSVVGSAKRSAFTIVSRPGSARDPKLQSNDRKKSAFCRPS